MKVSVFYCQRDYIYSYFLSCHNFVYDICWYLNIFDVLNCDTGKPITLFLCYLFYLFFGSSLPSENNFIDHQKKHLVFRCFFKKFLTYSSTENTLQYIEQCETLTWLSLPTGHVSRTTGWAIHYFHSGLRCLLYHKTWCVPGSFAGQHNLFYKPVCICL